MPPEIHVCTLYINIFSTVTCQNDSGRDIVGHVRLKKYQVSKIKYIARVIVMQSTLMNEKWCVLCLAATNPFKHDRIQPCERKAESCSR